MTAICGAAWWRRHPSPLPPWLHWTLDVPLPFVTPARLRALLAPGAGDRLFELGPGTGRHALHVASWIPRGRLDVCDVDDRALTRLAARAQRRRLHNLHTSQGDAVRLPYPDATFDGAYLSSVLGEVPDQDASLSELRRILKPNAPLVIGETPPVDPHFVSLRSLRRRAEAQGFRFERHTGPAALGFLARFVNLPISAERPPPQPAADVPTS